MSFIPGLAVVPRESNLGHFSLSFEELSSKVLEFVQAIIAGEKTLLFFFFNFHLLFIFKENLKRSHMKFSALLRKGEVVGILGYLSLQFA